MFGPSGEGSSYQPEQLQRPTGNVGASSLLQRLEDHADSDHDAIFRHRNVSLDEGDDAFSSPPSFPIPQTTTTTCGGVEAATMAAGSALSWPLPSPPSPLRTTNMRNKTLPDIDDLSVNQVFSYMEHYKIDLLWSFLSDSFFIAGSVAYIVLSVWDYQSQDSVETEGPLRNKYYIMLDVMAPFVYLLNSAVDIEWATRVQKRLADKHKLTQHWEESAAQYTMIDHMLNMSTTNNGVAAARSSAFPALVSVMPMPRSASPERSSSSMDCCASPASSWLWCRKLRKHAAHRRTVWAALSFGLAALCAVTAAAVRAWLDYHPESVLDDYFPNIDVTFDTISDHVYIVSAVISLTGKRNRPWLVAGPMGLGTNVMNDPERLEDLGDLLFFIGCVLDAVLTDARLTDLLYLGVVSSFLWLLDGCLYMQSDLVKAAHLLKTRADGVDVTTGAIV